VIFGYVRLRYLTLFVLFGSAKCLTVAIFVPETIRHSFIIASSEFTRVTYRNDDTDFGTANNEWAATAATSRG
jgi:hypothetical protein